MQLSRAFFNVLKFLNFYLLMIFPNYAKHICHNIPSWGQIPLIVGLVSDLPLLDRIPLVFKKSNQQKI
jgi:hypothetical protein